MGIEYRHFLVVNEPDWRPQPDTAARVESVLRDWSVVDRIEKVINLALGANNEVIDTSTADLPGPGLAFIYSGVQGLPVERIAGASMYGPRLSVNKNRKCRGTQSYLLDVSSANITDCEDAGKLVSRRL